MTPKVKPKRLDCALAAGCSVGHKPPQPYAPMLVDGTWAKIMMFIQAFISLLSVVLISYMML